MAAIALVLTYSRASRSPLPASGSGSGSLAIGSRGWRCSWLRARLRDASSLGDDPAGHRRPSPDVRDAERAGAWFALALVLGVAAALGLSHYAARAGERLSADARRRWALRLGGALAAVAAAAVVVAATVAIGGPESGSTSSAARAMSSRVGPARRVELEQPLDVVGESWELFRDAPAGGHGAHTFEIARRPIRASGRRDRGAAQRCSPGVGGNGLPGLLLGLAAAAFGLLACREALRRLDGNERAAGVALAVLLPVYLLHALADIDWDFVAASVPVLFAVGVLLAAGRLAEEPRSRCPRGARVRGRSRHPLLAHRAVARAARVEAAYEAIAENDVGAAVDAARQARDLNPLSVEPLWAWALADARRPDPTRTLRRYADATRLQPENSDTWFALGAYEARHRPLPRRVRPSRPRVRP